MSEENNTIKHSAEHAMKPANNTANNIAEHPAESATIKTSRNSNTGDSNEIAYNKKNIAFMIETIKNFESRTILGLTEEVEIISDVGSKKVLARIDTGATRSSIDIKLAAEFRLGPVLETRQIKSSLGIDLRPIIKAKIKIAGREIESTFTLADRNHMQYKILIGQNILKQGFLIDPLKENKIKENEKEK